jgi:glycosyltransferase involved in cell wall biosynthesis
MISPFSLVIPSFNEANRLGGTLVRVLDYLGETSPGSEVIVVDDGSTDGTSQVVRDVLEGIGNVEVRLLHESQNHGKGFAVRKGLLAATRPIALFSDADLSTPIDEAPKLLEPIAAGELDVAFGSRALNRRLIGNRQAWHREQGGRAFNLLVRLATGLPYWDTQCGFKAFRLDVFRPVLMQARSDGFSFDVELLHLARKAGLRMREIPVRWDHNEGSKVRFMQDSMRMLRDVVTMRLS